MTPYEMNQLNEYIEAVAKLENTFNTILEDLESGKLRDYNYSYSDDIRRLRTKATADLDALFAKKARAERI